MKTNILLLLTLSLALCLAGCCYVNVPGKITILSLFKDIDADELYYNDPNLTLWGVKYDSESPNAKLKVNPLTKTIELELMDSPKTPSD